MKNIKNTPQTPRFRRHMSDREIVNAALAILENHLSLSGQPMRLFLRRLGRQMKKAQTRQRAEALTHIIDRALARGDGRGFDTVGEMAVELYRLRPLLPSESGNNTDSRGFCARAIPSLYRAIAVLLCSGLVLCGGLVVYFLFPDGIFLEKKEVPDLVGTNIRTDAPDERYFVLAATYRYDADTEPGTVLSQSPAPGMIRKVEAGRHPCTLSVNVSLGPMMVEVGDYRGFTEHGARVACRRLGLIVKTKSLADHPRGNVAYTDPPAGEVLAAGSEITLYVGADRYAERVMVPNLVGVSEVTACSMLSSLGLIRGNVTYMASDQPAGTVIAQSVLSDTEVRAGARIGFVVSRGMER